ncbi:MAG: glycosyltransferase [Candidatus Moranbacteria bacterium]|nr:glycosyltransferase [Candidatus Moranbacteria bacterium]
MQKSKLDEITVVLVLHNEAWILEKTIRRIREYGINKIIVIDDASADGSDIIARNLGVQVVRTNTLCGYNVSVLRAAYIINTDFGIISAADVLIEKWLVDFLSFAIDGDYPLLMKEGSPYLKNPILNALLPDASRELKKRTGIFINNPDYDFVFCNRRMLDLIKDNVSCTGQFVHYDILREAINSKQKIGVYSIGPRSRYAGQESIVTQLRYLRRKIDDGSLSYFRYAFPDPSSKNFWRAILLSLISCLFTILIPKIIGS